MECSQKDFGEEVIGRQRQNVYMVMGSEIKIYSHDLLTQL